MSWDLQNAVTLCKEIEAVAPKFGYHVALTGGCLYKEGERKDLDLVFYKHGTPDIPGLLLALSGLGIAYAKGSGWKYVGYFCADRSKQVDLLFPEERKNQI